MGPHNALAFGLIVNELCTNTVKYGALSADGGRVEITGTVDAGVLSLVWAEIGGPVAGPPVVKSFGTRMIESAMPDADVQLDFRPCGVVCQMRIPLASLDE